jgi:hypothetical protein
MQDRWQDGYKRTLHDYMIVFLLCHSTRSGTAAVSPVGDTTAALPSQCDARHLWAAHRSWDVAASANASIIPVASKSARSRRAAAGVRSSWDVC